MELHIGDGVRELLAVSALVAWLIWGWKLFRLVITLAMASAVGALSFIVMGFVANGLGAGISDTVQVATLFAFMGWLAGIWLGWKYQQLCAAVGTFVVTGTLGALVAYLTLQGQSSADGGAMVVGLVVGISCSVLMNAVYDIGAAGIMAAFVALSFVPAQRSMLEWIFDERSRSLMTLLREIAAQLARSAWAAVIVPVGVVSFACWLRAVAWTSATEERSPELTQEWRGALLASGSILAVSCFIALAFNFGEVFGVHEFMWPGMACLVYFWHRRMAQHQPKITARQRYVQHLVLLLALHPMIASIELFVVRDLPSLSLSDRELYAVTYFKRHLGAILWPSLALGAARADDSTTLAAFLAVKWASLFGLAPWILERAWRSRFSDEELIEQAAAAELPGEAVSSPGVSTLGTAWGRLRQQRALLAAVAVAAVVGSSLMGYRAWQIRRLRALADLPMDRPSVRRTTEQFTAGSDPPFMRTIEAVSTPLPNVNGQSVISVDSTTTWPSGRVRRRNTRLSLGSDGYAFLGSAAEGESYQAWSPPRLIYPLNVSPGARWSGTYHQGARTTQVVCSTTAHPSCSGGIVVTCSITEDGLTNESIDAACPGTGACFGSYGGRFSDTGGSYRVEDVAITRDGVAVPLCRP